MKVEIWGPSSQSHFLSLRSVGGQFSWGRILIQGDLTPPQHTVDGYPGMCHSAGLRLRQELQGSKGSRHESRSLCSHHGWDGGSPRPRQPQADPWPHLFFAWHIFIHDRNTAKIFRCPWSLHLTAKYHCSNICRNMPFALLFKSRVFPGGSGPDSWAEARLTGAPVPTCT